jgi:uncharacterized OB-fold protein
MAPTSPPEPVTSPLEPVTDDVDTGPFFAAARQHRLVILHCAGCHAVLHMPRAYCHRCGSWDTHWDDMSGRAALYTWTAVTHQVHPAFPVPYTVVVVKLDDADVNLMGSLPGLPELRIGQAMEVWYQTVGDAVVPNWRPA